MADDRIQIATTIKRKRILKVGKNNSQTEPGRKVAAIRVSGQYLEDLGFVAGGYMELVVNDDRSITLRPISAEEKAHQDAAKSAVVKPHE